MDKQTFRQRVENEILILDGAMGTMLQPHLQSGYCLELTNLEKPDLVVGVYSAYVDSGADIISTNTFGASRIKLQEFELADRTREINLAAARLAKKASGDRICVAGCIGPTGRLIDPMGPLGFEEAYETFKEQAMALAEGGVDIILMETFSDLKEIKIGILAIRENTDLPIMASMTFEEDFLTFTGTDPITAANILTSMGVDAVGVNCSTGPEPMLEVLGRYVLVTDCPIFIEPNAGLPRLHEEGVRYQVSEKEMADYGEKFVEIGANIIGSCCGSTPEFTKKLREQLKKKRPLSRKVDSILRLSSRVNTVDIGASLPFCIIGERINPTNREDLSEAIRCGKLGLIQKEAQMQMEEGAHLLDVNIGVPGINEPGIMERVVQNIENVTKAPLSIDSVNPRAVEAALRESAGKILINSVNGEEKSLDHILPLARRFGAGLLCLAVGEGGIPKTAEERFAVLKKIVNRAESSGIKRENLICDCLTLTVSAEQKRAEETLKAIRMMKGELRLPTVLGVSNISFGLPERSLINATFLGMAMAEGLDAAIMNPGDSRMIETVRAASVLTLRDRDSKNFVRSHLKKRKSKKIVAEQPILEGEVDEIFNAVLTGNREEIGPMVEKALASGRSALEINDHMLIPAIEEIGNRYDRKEIYLPQMILAAETMQRAFHVLEPHFGSSESLNAGTVVICTVRGDVHDIGKNIVGLFLQNQGFRVIDLGKDVPIEKIVEKVEEFRADVVGLSALMTTTMVEMPMVIKALREAGSDAKVIVGGAVVTKRYATEIGADGYAKDGVTAGGVVKEMVWRRREGLASFQS